MTKIKYALMFLLSFFSVHALHADADDVRADRDVLDLFDRNEGQVDYNPYDYPSDIEPYNTRSIYWPEMKRIETLAGYQDPYSGRSIHDTIPEMRDKTFTSRINYSPFENGFPQQLNNQLSQANNPNANNNGQNPQQNPQQNMQNQQQNTQQAQATNYPYNSYYNQQQAQYGQNNVNNSLYYQTQYQQAQTQYGQNSYSNYNYNNNPYSQQTQNEYYPSEYDNQYYNNSR
jgi:hypothetical protein